MTTDLMRGRYGVLGPLAASPPIPQSAARRTSIVSLWDIAGKRLHRADQPIYQYLRQQTLGTPCAD